MFHKYREQERLDEFPFRWGDSAYIATGDPNEPIKATGHYDASGNRYQAKEFWHEKFNAKTKRWEVDLEEDKYLDWLTEMGFCRTLDLDGSTWRVVQTEGKICRVLPTGKRFTYLHDFVRSHLYERGDKNGIKLLLRNAEKMLSERLLASLPYVDGDFMRCNAEACFLPFQNGVLRITAKDVELLPIDQAPGFVYEDELIGRDYEPCSYEDIEQSVFFRFLNNATNGSYLADQLTKNRSDYSRPIFQDEAVTGTIEGRAMLSALSSIGYMLYRYNDPTVTKMVVLVDANTLQQGTEAEGGTGKGIIGKKALSQWRRQLLIMGRMFDPSDKHCFEEYDYRSHDHVFVPDLEKGVNINPLINFQTEGFTIKRMYQGKVTIPMHLAPKFILDTNYSLSGSGNTYDRRIHYHQLSDHYNKHHQPPADFGGKMLFTDWDRDQWRRFDALAAYCVQCYLRHGLQEADLEGYKIKKLNDDIDPDAIEFFEGLPLAEGIPTRSYTSPTSAGHVRGLVDLFNDEYRKNRRPAKLTTLTRWLNKWARTTGHRINDDRNGARDRRRPMYPESSRLIDFVTITADPDKAQNLDPNSDDLPAPKPRQNADLFDQEPDAFEAPIE